MAFKWPLVFDPEGRKEHSIPLSIMVVPPDDPSWRRNNHRFENIPSNVQGYVRQQLKIPPIHLATLLPDLEMSIIDLVYSTTIPPICDDREQAGYFIPIGHSFFATELPVEDIQHLMLVTVPPKGVIAITYYRYYK
jgi:hypothetical protein